MLERDDIIELFEKLDESLDTDEWKSSILEYIKPYERYINVLYSLESCIERNDLYLIKRLIKDELEMMKGVREKNCKRYKINKGYCSVCNNAYCSLNENIKYNKRIN